MEAKQAKVEELRSRLGAWKKKEERLAYSLYPPGLPRGGLVEITGPGKTEAVAALLAEHGASPAAWIEQDFCLFPSALAQRRVALDKIFFIEGKNDAAWAAGLVLRSQLFPFLVYGAPYGEEKELRRFQLLAERANCTMLLLADAPCGAWPVTLSLEMREGRPEARLP